MKHFLYFLLFNYIALHSYAQAGVYKYDISQGVNNSFPQYLTPFGEKLCFFSADGTKGWEPWVADSAGNFQLIGDVNTQINTSSLQPSVYKKPTCVVDNKFYFGADNGFAGAELYVWAGGTSTPSLAADIEPGLGGSFPDNMALLNFDIYFKAATSAEGTELWKYSTVMGLPFIVKDLNPGPDSSVTGNVTAYNSQIVFTAKTNTTGNEIFMYDPLLDTMTLLLDINPGPASSNPQDFTVVNGTLYFSADDGSHGRELYSYSGVGYPLRVTDIYSGISSSIANYGNVPHIAGYKNKVYFSATNGNTEYHIYSYDPATSQAALACSTNSAGSSEATWLTEYGGKLYFSAFDTSYGLEIWAYDGTAALQRITDICAGKGNGKPQNLTVIGTNLYFRAMECNNGIGDELFRYNYLTVDVKKVSFEGEVKLYPNPVKETTTLEISLRTPQRLKVNLTDAMGKTVWETRLNAKATANTITIPTASLVTGSYQYSVYTIDGVFCAGGKFVKQ